MRESHAWSPPSGEKVDAGLSVRVLGVPGRTVVLLHGLLGSQRYFGAAYDALAQSARLVVPDLLGFGESPRPSDVDYGLESHTQALIKALERLEVSGPLVLVGHSAGVRIAIRLAASRPDLVAGVIGFGPVLYAGAREAREHVARLGLFVRLFALETVWARWTCAWMCRHRALAARIAAWMRPELPRPVAEDSVQHSWPSYSGTIRRLVIEAQPPMDLDRVECPVRLVAGKDDLVLDLRYLRKLAEMRSNVTLELWPGDHDLPLVAPEQCVEIVQEMLDAL